MHRRTMPTSLLVLGGAAVTLRVFSAKRPRVVIIGSEIAGLSAAHDLQAACPGDGARSRTGRTLRSR